MGKYNSGFEILDSNVSICLKESADFLNENYPDSSALVGFEPGFRPHFKGETVFWSRKEFNVYDHPNTDFVILNLHNLKKHTPKTLYRVFRDDEPIHKITVNNLECAYIYKNKEIWTEEDED